MLVKTLLAAKGNPVVIAAPTTSIDDGMDMLITNGIGCLPVVDVDSQLIGIVSDKDIFKQVHRTRGKYHHLSLGDVMTTKVIVGVPDDDIAYIAQIMDKNWIRHIPIMDKDRLIGVVSLRDINKTLVKNAEAENRYLNMYMDDLNKRDHSGS